MNGPIKMYRTKPIVKQDLPVQIPKCMYPMKNIHSRDTRGMVDECIDHVSTANKNSTIFNQNNSEVPGMAELLAKQEAILKQLWQLKNQVESIKAQGFLKCVPQKKESCSTNSLNTISAGALPRVPVELPDIIVINASPEHPPFSLQILQKVLHDTLDLNFTFHLHSSVATLAANAEQLEHNLLNYQKKAGIHKLNVRLIWKDVGPNPEFLVSRYPIVGEVNLLRYLARVIKSSLSYDSDADSIEIDSILDTCYLIARSKSKTERAPYLVSLNKSLGKSQWLGGRSKYSIADIAAYSAFKQTANGSEINVNMTKWYQRCESI